MSLKENTYSIVLRFRGLFPRQLGKFKMHGDRSGGQLDHIDHAESHRNETLVGGPDWISELRADIHAAAAANLAAEIAARLQRQRPAEAAKVAARGPVDPWASSKEGPLREGILSVNAEWFGGAGYANWDPEKVAAFREQSLSFLRTHFGAAIVHARIDCDEEALHLHFIIAPWHTKTSANRGAQKLLQPSSQPLLKDYEHAQDLAGAHFAALGLVRGQQHAEARRKAKARGEKPPAPVFHVPPPRWRAAQKRKLLEAEAHLREAANDLAATDARLAAEKAELRRKAAQLCALRDQQIALQHGIDHRLHQLAAEIALLQDLWQESGLAPSPALTQLGERYRMPGG